MSFQVGDKVQDRSGDVGVVEYSAGKGGVEEVYHVRFGDESATFARMAWELSPAPLKFIVGDQFAWDQGMCSVIQADRNKTPPYKIVYQGGTKTKDFPTLDADVEWVVPTQCMPAPQANPNPKKAFGETKPNLALIPPAATLHAAMAFELGASKYGAFNWRKDPVENMTYIAAAMRHLQNYLDGEEYCADAPEVHNLAAAIAGLGIVLDAMELGNLIDNRPPAGRSSDIQERMKAAKVARSKK